MKKAGILLAASLFSSSLMAGYVMHINQNDNTVLSQSCSDVDSIKVRENQIHIFTPEDKGFDATELSLTFEVESASDTVRITYNGESAPTIENPYPETIAISNEGAHVNVNCINELKDVIYLLSGTSSNGSFTIDSPKKFSLMLNNLSLTSKTEQSPIRSFSSKTMTVILPNSTSSILTDTPNDTCKAVIRSKGQIVFSSEGNGSLEVVGKSKRAIQTGDYLIIEGGNIISQSADGEAIKANDYFIMNGGSVVGEGGLEVSAGYAILNDGKLTLSSDEPDAKVFKIAKDLEKAGSSENGTFIMKGGELNITSTGAGSKGIKAEHDILIQGGTINGEISGGTLIEGTDVSYSALIKADRNFEMLNGAISIQQLAEGQATRAIGADSAITVNGGKIQITANCKEYITTKGKTKVGYGFKSEGLITINNGTVEIISTPTTNAAICMTTDRNIIINGGSLRMESASNNTLDGEGAYMIINGGKVFSFSGYGYSASTRKIQSNGGIFVGVGSKNIIALNTTYCVGYDSNYKLGETVCIKDATGQPLIIVKSPSAFANSTITTGYLTIGVPGVIVGNSYEYSTGGTATGESELSVYNANASYEGGEGSTFTGTATQTNMR